MEEIKFLVCGNNLKDEIMDAIENLNFNLNMNLVLKDCSKSSHSENIEYYCSLINNIQYFNALVLNFEKKEEIFNFFKVFDLEDSGISKECYPFFIICDKILPKIEAKKFIDELNKSKNDDYKFNFGNFLFFREIKEEEFQLNIVNIYNCYFQESKKIGKEDDSKETINILLIGVKSTGKSSLINKLLWETRALSMENHYTTKLNAYQHRKYPIVFYDIAGFNENEDDEFRNLNSKIEEFNKDYKNIKNRIHCIFYVIDCNNVRIFQHKEKKLINQIFEINIPIFIVGQKAKKTNIQNFIRRTKFELDTLPTKYEQKKNILKNRIFCLDSSKESYLSLLNSVNEEFLLSKKLNEKIIEEYSAMNEEEIINQSFSEEFNINKSNEEKKNVLKIYDCIKESIFFNNFLETIKEVYKNVLRIREKYLSQKYYLKNLEIETLSNEIEAEFLKIFSQEDLEKINKLLKEQQKDLTNKGKDIGELKYYYGGSAAVIIATVPLSILLTPFCFISFPILGIVDAVLLKKRDNKTKEIINENIENFYLKFERRYILINLNIIHKKAARYNKVIDEFNSYIKDCENYDFIN